MNISKYLNHSKSICKLSKYEWEVLSDVDIIVNGLTFHGIDYITIFDGKLKLWNHFECSVYLDDIVEFKVDEPVNVKTFIGSLRDSLNCFGYLYKVDNHIFNNLNPEKYWFRINHVNIYKLDYFQVGEDEMFVGANDSLDVVFAALSNVFLVEEFDGCNLRIVYLCESD